MRKLIILIFLFPLLLSAQVRDTLSAGKIAIGTIGNKDTAITIDVPTIIGSKFGVLKADEVFYVRKNSSLDTISTFSFTANKTPSVLFERGGKWIGTVTVPRNNVIYSSWGTGANPVITGFATISGWTNEGNGIYSKTLTVESNPEIVTVNGVQYAMGRTPNSNRYAPVYSDYYHIDSYSGVVSITDSECDSATVDWAGAEIVVKSDGYSKIWMKYPITNHTGTTLTFSGGTTAQPNGVGFGYFIQNDLRTLDQLGEWYYGGGKFYMYFGGNNPTNYTVKVATKNKLIDVGRKSDIIIKNLSFEGANTNAVNTEYGFNTENLTVLRCAFNFNYRGIYGHTAPEMTVKNCTFNNSAASAIYQHWYSDGTYFGYNTIDSTGLIVGIAAGTTYWNGGIAATISHSKHTYSSKNTIVEHNSIKNSGYMGLVIQGDSAKVRYNYIDTYCINENDGGGIYYGDHENIVNMFIDHNVVLNGLLNNEADGFPTGSPSSASYNIYFDYESSGGHTVSNNIIGNSAGYGLMLHGSPNMTVVDNKIYNCNEGLVFQQLNSIAGGIDSARNNIIKRNEIVATEAGQTMVWARSVINDFYKYGDIDSNRYVAHVGNIAPFATLVNTWSPTYRAFSGWKGYTTLDDASTTTFNTGSTVFDYYVGDSTKTVNLGATWMLPDSTEITSYTLNPFEGIIAFKDTLPPVYDTVGYITIGGSAAYNTGRVAMPVTFTENGIIESITLYHGTGTGNMLVGVYSDNTGAPNSRLAISSETAVTNAIGWQTIPLISPLSVTAGTTVWLSWIFQNSVYAYYTVASPTRRINAETWSYGLPASFGTSTTGTTKYSIFCTIRKNSMWLILLLLPQFFIEIFGNWKRRNKRK